MRTGNLFRIIGVLFMLLCLVGVSTYAAAGQAPADVQALDATVPEIRAAGFSYSYLESPIAAGQARVARDILTPSAVEGQPRELDWTPVRRVAVHPGNSQVLYAAIDNLHGLWRSTNGGDFWEQMPFGVGSGRTIVFANSSVAAATFGYYDSDSDEYLNGGIWRTSDGGNVWEDVSTGIANMVVAVAFDPIDPDRIYASTYGAGIYRGDYSGGSVAWTQINSGLADTWIYSIAVSPTHPNILYAGGYYEVYRSDDYGGSWIIADSTYPSDYTEALAIPSGDGNTWYAGAHRLDTSGPLTDAGFYKSTAGVGTGALVLKNSGMTDTFVLDIAQDPLNPDILYAGTWGSGFFRSDDAGDTWVEKNANLYIPYIYGIEAVADLASPTGVTLYLANFYDGAGQFVSTDRGETWLDPAVYLLPEKFDVTTSTSPQNLAIATGQGVFGSDDGGVNWWYSPDLTGLRNGIVLELARDPNNSSKLLAATYGGGIWSSTSAGGFWTETSTGIGGGAYVYDIGFSSTANTAYAGSWGVYRTTDGGATWAPFGSLLQWVRDVDGHNATTANLYAGTNDAGVFMSPNANGTWSNISAGLGDLRVRSVKAVGANQIFAGTNGDSAWKYNGTSWTQKGPFIRAPGVNQIAIHPTNDAIIYAATDQGVYYSSNSGESWTPRNKGLGGYGDLVVSGISIDPNNPSIVYLGTWGYGVFKSTDAGDHWTRLSDPLKCSKVYLPLVLRNYAPPIPLLNGDFEQGPTVGWGQHSDQGWPLILHESQLAEGVTAHSGEWATWLGGDDDEFSVIWQEATIPTSDPTLSFYRWDASEDACGNDYGLVYIDGGYPYASWQLCSDNNTHGWVWSGVDLSEFAGQTVEIAIAAKTNGSLNSNLFVDDVTLGSTSLADPSVQAGSLTLDDTAGKQGLLPNPTQYYERTPSRWFLPMHERLEPQGLLDLSD